MYSQRAIPTTYRGISFRSRLEAKWAAFLDNLGLKYIYEPADLRGWAPDFLLPGCETFVEAKPIVNFCSAVATKVEAAMTTQGGRVLLVGMAISAAPSNALHLGWLGVLGDNGWTWDDAYLTSGGKVVQASTASWGALVQHHEAEPKWIAAGNQVQWVPS